jgi:integrase
LAKHCNIIDSNSVLDYLARKHVSNARKELMFNCYVKFCQWKGISFNYVRYRREDRLPYVPLEKDIEALISELPRKLGILTLTVKETGARAGEVWALKWVDVNSENTVTINNPEKGSRARKLKVSTRLVSLLSTLPKQEQSVFKKRPKASIESFRDYYIREKRKIASKTQNPNIRAITWKSLRHWKATIEYQRTKDIPCLRNILGHVNIQNTLVYTHLVNYSSEEFTCKAATSLDEAKTLIEQGAQATAGYMVCPLVGRPG